MCHDVNGIVLEMDCVVPPFYKVKKDVSTGPATAAPTAPTALLLSTQTNPVHRLWVHLSRSLLLLGVGLADLIPS